jgi:hypothetical protein
MLIELAPGDCGKLTVWGGQSLPTRHYAIYLHDQGLPVATEFDKWKAEGPVTGVPAPPPSAPPSSAPVAGRKTQGGGAVQQGRAKAGTNGRQMAANKPATPEKGKRVRWGSVPANWIGEVVRVGKFLEGKLVSLVPFVMDFSEDPEQPENQVVTDGDWVELVSTPAVTAAGVADLRARFGGYRVRNEQGPGDKPPKKK